MVKEVAQENVSCPRHLPTLRLLQQKLTSVWEARCGCWVRVECQVAFWLSKSLAWLIEKSSQADNSSQVLHPPSEQKRWWDLGCGCRQVTGRTRARPKLLMQGLEERCETHMTGSVWGRSYGKILSAFDHWASTLSALTCCPSMHRSFFLFSHWKISAFQAKTSYFHCIIILGL